MRQYTSPFENYLSLQIVVHIIDYNSQEFLCVDLIALILLIRKICRGGIRIDSVGGQIYMNI